MTALYAIAAVIVLAGIMTGAYLIGFGDGITAERMRLRELDIIVKDSIIKAHEQAYKLHHHDGEAYPQQEQEQRHQLTSADLAQMEQEARNKQAEKEQA
jgi:hypothetical protein